MIEPTDEMVRAYDDAAWENPVELGGLEMANVREGLAAVLAIVERDYEIVLRGAPGNRCRCDMRPRPVHELGSPGCYAHVEPGMCNCRPGEGKHEFGVEGCQGFAP